MRTYKNMKGKSLPGFCDQHRQSHRRWTGKTPASCMMAEWALGKDTGRPYFPGAMEANTGESPLVVSNGGEITGRPEEAGDEPILWPGEFRCPRCPLKEAIPCGMMAFGKFGCNFFVLDDGFQHTQLKRDIDLVLIDHDNPFGNGHLLPWGPLREPKNHLDRAHAFILTRSGGGGTGAGEHFLKRNVPG